jgi:hypothetical protein
MEGALDAPLKPDIGFVACIEGGLLERQALLLFESIRLYTGRFQDSALYALSPRAGHPISSAARRRLEALDVQYTDALLNTGCPEYGSANRVAAAAHIEATCPHDLLVILDSDTLFLREPREFIFPPEVDVAVRPVDTKGISTSGPEDSFDVYWRNLCDCCGVDYNILPWSESFTDQCRIKANYNGGLVVARGNLGLMRRWADFFFTSIRHGLRPVSSSGSFRAGAGWVDPAVGTLWGSNQAALALAIWSTTRRVRELPPTYNYPLHQHAQIDPALAQTVFSKLVHVHYHWLLDEDALPTNPLFLPSPAGPLSTRQQNWLRPKAPKGKGIVCVLGMHRSGTSLTARIINLLGVDLGTADELMEPDETNVAGFWEHTEIVDLNEQLLARLGGSWDQPPQLSPGWEGDPGLADLRRQAQSILERFEGVELWGWKDPRTCLTLPFWQTLITQPISYILCLRNPVEVAASLAQRDGFDFEKSVRLWATYTQLALEYTASRPRHFIFYEDFLREAQTTRRSLARFLGKSQLAERAQTRKSIERFINSDLRHHHTPVPETIADPRLMFPVKALYTAMRFALSRPGQPQAETQQVITLLARQLADFQSDFDKLQSQANNWEKQADHWEKRAVEREAHLELIYQSTSWRLTRPLRLIGDTLRGRNTGWLAEIVKRIFGTSSQS